MAKVRVYELAKELGVENEAVMDQLREMGEFVRTASSTIEAPAVRRLKEVFAAKAAEQGPRASQWGQPRPAAALRPGDSVTHAHWDAELPPGLIRELLESWDLVGRLAPDPGLAVRFLADQSRLAPFDVDRVRRVRNQCAHPVDQGWPQRYDLDMALTTARELRRRLKADGH